MLTKEQKACASKLGSISRSRSVGNVFSDWLEIAAIAMHQLPYKSGDLEKDAAFASPEANCLERMKLYSQEELGIFSELLGMTLAAPHAGHGDFLGEIAGEAALPSKRGGQFFTPYHLCQAISKMTFGDVQAAVAEKGLLTVCEPAVGAGALVIASAEEIASQGVDPRAHVQFDCTDISRDAFNMAYIQLSSLGLQAVVRHGNTLSMEYWESRPTMQLLLFHQWQLRQQRSEQLTQSVKALLSEAVTPIPERSLPAFSPDALDGKGKQPKPCGPRPDIVLDRQLDLFS